MFPQFNIFQIRIFINKERVYMLMLCFIILFNVWMILAQKLPWMQEGFAGEKVFSLSHPKLAEEPSFSLKTPEEIYLSEVFEKQRHLPFLFHLLGFAALSVFALGLFLDIRFLMAKLKKRKAFQIFELPFQVSWGIWDVFKLAIIFIFLGYILHIIEAKLFSSLFGESKLHFITLLNTGIMDLLLLGFIIYFVKIKYKQNLTVIGLKLKGALKNIFLAFLSYIAFLPVLTVILLVLVWLAAIFNYTPTSHTLFQLFLEENRMWMMIYATIMVLLMGPITEEIFFRGFVYNAIKGRWGCFKAITLTAVIFAGLHGNTIGFLPILALGILLAYLYELTNSLIPAITIHILHNSLMLSLLFMARYFMRIAQ